MNVSYISFMYNILLPRPDSEVERMLLELLSIIVRTDFIRKINRTDLSVTPG